MNPNPGNQEPLAENWEQLHDDGTKNQPNPTSPTKEGGENKPVRKKLQLKKGKDFVSNPDAKEDFAVFFKDEIEAFLKAKSGRMFQSTPVVPITKTFAVAKDEPKKDEKKPAKEAKVDTKEERKEKEILAQKANKEKSKNSLFQ